MDDKSIVKTTSALNGHGIAWDDPTNIWWPYFLIYQYIDVFFDLRLNKQWSKQWEAGDLRC